MAQNLQQTPPLPEITHLGPKMRALQTDRERAFVWAYLNNGGRGGEAALAAGYAKGHPRTQAWRLVQRQDILDAMHECTWRVLSNLAPKAAQVLGKLLDSEDEKVQLKAVDMIFARTGFIAKTGVEVVEKTLSGADMVKAIREAATQLGMDAAKLLEGAAIEEPRKLAPPLPFKREAEDAQVVSTEEEIEW